MGPEHLDLDKHIERGTAEVIKNGAHRAVYRIRIDDHFVYWKHCRIHGLASYLRQWLRPAKAHLEFNRAQALAARGIDTVEPLAWSRPWQPWAGASHLITRELTGAIPMHQYLLERSRGEARREAAKHLGLFLARLHDAGVAHPDLHPGNILVVLDAAGQPRFHLLDIHNVRLRRSLSLGASRSNLVVFNRFFSLHCERADRACFWKSYAHARGLKHDVARALARDVEKRTRDSNLRLWEDRDRRCLAANRSYRRVLSPLARGHAVATIDEATLQRFLADPDAPFREEGVKLLKDSASSTVAELMVDTPAGPRPMIYKRFNLKKRFAALTNWLRPSAALRSWQMGHALLDRYLPTPRPWLFLHRRGLTGPREGYLLCEKVEAAVDLVQFFRPVTGRGKWDAVAALGRLLGRLHETGLSHRDLKATNILVNTVDDIAHFHFIDLVGVRRHRHISDAVRAQNLARLNVSFLQEGPCTRTDRLRFLRAYLRWALHGSANWKTWWKQIAAASEKKIARNQKSGRVLT